MLAADISVVYPPIPGWTQITVGNNGELRDISYGNGVFVAVSSYRAGLNEPYEGESLVSADSLNWESHSAPWGGFPELLFDGDRFVAAYGNRVYAIPSGIAWTVMADLDPSFACTGIAYGRGTYVVVGSEGPDLLGLRYGRMGLRQRGERLFERRPLCGRVWERRFHGGR